MDPKKMKKLQKDITLLWKLHDKGRRTDEVMINKLMLQWQQALVARKLANEMVKRQRAFLKQLLTEPSLAGLMTYGVPAKTRQRHLRERQVVFAITKYGKEGLDCPELDTVLVSSLFSGKNALQQLMGRPTRPTPGKKKPMVVFYVDNVGQSHGMSQKLMKHLRDWPHEEGGPFNYELLDYPRISTCKTSTLKAAFGQ
jgi:superfamily II DNA or RNA helicase